MKNKNSEVEPICANCENSRIIRESDMCICSLVGAVRETYGCKKFKLDLLKLSPLPRVLPDDETTFVDM